MHACQPARSIAAERATSSGTPPLPQGRQAAAHARTVGSVLKPTGGKSAVRT